MVIKIYITIALFFITLNTNAQTTENNKVNKKSEANHRDIEMVINDTLLIRKNMERYLSVTDSQNSLQIYDLKNNVYFTKSDSLKLLGKKPNWKNLLSYAILMDSSSFRFCFYVNQNEIIYYLMNTYSIRYGIGSIYIKNLPKWKYGKNSNYIYIYKKQTKQLIRIDFKYRKEKWEISRTIIPKGKYSISFLD